jgi:hypothetical protein
MFQIIISHHLNEEFISFLKQVHPFFFGSHSSIFCKNHGPREEKKKFYNGFMLATPLVEGMTKIHYHFT